jgi:pilus assembly protein CpaB
LLQKEFNAAGQVWKRNKELRIPERRPVRTSTIVMIAFAVVFGVLAVFVAQSWLHRQAELRLKNMEATQKPVVGRTVVVAGAPLRFGMQLSPQALREVAWPQEAIPAGTFESIQQLMSGGKRIVLASIEANEPVLASKITGPGQRATLSAVIGQGMRAITIRVNDVEGVAGFVLPGDHVDVLLTRQSDKQNGNNDVVLQNVKVLAVDQLADDSSDKPALAKAVTLEVDTSSAQKLSLAASLGMLSLVLRKAGEASVEGTRRVSVGDLVGSGAALRAGEGTRYAKIVVTRPAKREEYSVPAEGPDWREATSPR